MFSKGIVAVEGSRSLPGSGLSLVSKISNELVSSGCILVCGCCKGADETCFSSVPAKAVSVYAAFGKGGKGSCAVSAVSAVSAFADRGGSVHWWAGGSLTVPMRARLAIRTRAVISAASSGLVVFFGSNQSCGSLLAARIATKQGLSVVAFPIGFSGNRLPALEGPGKWAASNRSGLWASSWVWESAYIKKLFE